MNTIEVKLKNKHNDMSEIIKIQNALTRQRNRTATFEDINYLIQKESQYGTLNTRVIQSLIQWNTI